jgi:putative NADPH-quinone reductase
MAAPNLPPILVLDAHPDPAPGHLVSALASAYAEGAREAGRPVEMLRLAEIEAPVLRDPADLATPPPAVRAAQEAVTRRRHLVVVHPLWLGAMPAFSTAFFEQLFRAQFAMAPAREGRWPRRILARRSARVVVTMGCRRSRTGCSSAATP